MKERVTTFILITIFLIFCIFNYFTQQNPVVLKVITPVKLQIDINKNNIADDDETFCIEGINSFTADIKQNNPDLAKATGLTYGQSLAIGYIADEFATNLLEGKGIEIKISQTPPTPDCRYAQIYLGEKSYSDILTENGYTIKENKIINPDKFKEIEEKASKLNLVIMNHRSGKYHTLDCKYGLAARDSVILPLKDIEKNSKPCRFCHVDKHQKHDIKTSKNIYNEDIPDIPPPPNTVTDGNIQLILTDFTRILKPDRTCSHAACKALLQSINSTTKTMDIAAYGLSDIPAINKALIDAKNRGVKIRVVYDTNTKHENYYEDTDDILKQIQETKSDEIKGNPQLTNMLMHNKFAIFDGKKVYTGSMNFSTTGLSGFNHNSIIIINSEQIADLYTKEFNQMFSGKFHTLKNKTQNNANIKNGSSIISVYFSPQDKGFINTLVPLIKNSKKYIYIPTFLFTHKTMKEELIKAHQRGVEIKIIIDATNTAGKHSVFKELRESGIPVKVENYAGKMHAKTMIIDDEYLVAGSANFSNSGENKNDENMLVIKNPKLTRAYKDYFDYLWKRIPDKYLTKTVNPESKYSVGSCYDGVDNDFDGKIDNQDSGCKN